MMVKTFLLKIHHRDFPRGPVVKTVCIQCKEHKFIPWSGKLSSHIPHAPKSLRMVTATMQLKDTCSLEEKL